MPDSGDITNYFAPSKSPYCRIREILRWWFEVQFPKLAPQDWIAFAQRTWRERGGRLVARLRPEARPNAERPPGCGAGGTGRRAGEVGRAGCSELRELIQRMSKENPLWGAPRIHGELLKLGFEIAESTVSKYMIRRRGPPSQSWRTFLRNHAEAIAAIATDPDFVFSLL
jgi:hypothetical protein